MADNDSLVFDICVMHIKIEQDNRISEPTASVKAAF